MLDRLMHFELGSLDLTGAIMRATGRYTRAEVAAILRACGRGCGHATAGASSARSDRARAILACATQPSEWMWRLDGATEWKLGLRLYYRLPTIVAWYLAGQTPEEVAARISMFGGTASALRALDAAARCIANRLNDGTLPPVRGAA